MRIYKQLKVSVEPRLAEQFKRHCADSGTSMTRELCRLMQSSMGAPPVRARLDADRLSTRGHRRAAIRRIITHLEAVKEHEERYMEGIPENLHGGMHHEAAVDTVDALSDAISLLEEAF